MILCAAPRSGGTIHGKTLAEQLGIQFGGEVGRLNVRGLHPYAGYKSASHEVEGQPVWDIDGYIDVVKRLESPSYLYLVNLNVEFVLDRADFFVVRRNPAQAARSMAHYLLRNGARSWPVLLWGINSVMRETALILHHTARLGIAPDYFEDVYDRRTEYDFETWGGNQTEIESQIAAAMAFYGLADQEQSNGDQDPLLRFF